MLFRSIEQLVECDIKFSDCKIEERNGFLKYVCYQKQDEGYIATEYKCTHSDEFYTKLEHPIPLKWLICGCSQIRSVPTIHISIKCATRG